MIPRAVYEKVIFEAIRKGSTVIAPDVRNAFEQAISRETMDILRHAVNRFMVDTVLSFAPVKDCTVQIRDVPERTSCKEVFLYKADQTLHLALRKGISELETDGVVVKERANAAGVTAAEAKQLNKAITRLQREIQRLKEKLNAQEKAIEEKDTEIADLVEQLEIERGNTFLKQKREFAQRRI